MTDEPSSETGKTESRSNIGFSQAYIAPAQAEPHKLEFDRFLRSDAAEILGARERSRVIHGKDIDAAGAEVELTSRLVLSRRLPRRYYLGHGHIVDRGWNESPQFDAVIADNSNAPVLYRTQNGTEYFPFEAVYAVGEVKATYRRSDKQLDGFARKIETLSQQLSRADLSSGFPGFAVDPSPSIEPATPVRGNPIFRFMLCADAGDFDIDRDKDTYERLLPRHLPAVLCLLGRGVLVATDIDFRDGDFVLDKFGLTPEFNSEFLWGWLPTSDPAMAYGLLYSLLLVFLSRVHLEEWNIGAYLLPLLDFEPATGFPMLAGALDEATRASPSADGRGK